MKSIVNNAHDAFMYHKIIKQEKDRWLIKKVICDKQYSVYFAEIISLCNGRLFVGGDIDDCVFAYFSDTNNIRDKLNWIGKCKDLSYVTQKASIGLSDGGKLTMVGKNPTSRVIYAWAAVKKLCELLEKD
jgi:hypothetical protein